MVEVLAGCFWNPQAGKWRCIVQFAAAQAVGSRGQQLQAAAAGCRKLPEFVGSTVWAITLRPGGRLTQTKACLAAHEGNKKVGKGRAAQNHRQNTSSRQAVSRQQQQQYHACQYHACAQLAFRKHGWDGRSDSTARLPAPQATRNARAAPKFALLPGLG